jgi:hypothetical protein
MKTEDHAMRSAARFEDDLPDTLPGVRAPTLAVWPDVPCVRDTMRDGVSFEDDPTERFARDDLPISGRA